MRWSDLSTEFLRAWRGDATDEYVRAVTDPHRKKDGERTAGQLALIENTRILLRCIATALEERGEA